MICIMPRYDKVIVELILLFVAFLAFYVFSPDISSLFHSAASTDIKVAKSLFLFLAYFFSLFRNMTAFLLLYLIGGGLIILNGRRE